MKQLLIEEMKRAINIMESKDKLKKTKRVENGKFGWMEIDREITELRQLLLSIRKHSIILEKDIN